MMTCFLPVALTAALNAGLSQAFTSPWRLMMVALGCIARTSSVIGPFGPVRATLVSLSRSLLHQALAKRVTSPVSVLVVRIVGRPKILPSSACARMLFFICTADWSREIW